MSQRESLSIPDLPPKVRLSLEDFLQHREQMRGRRCVGARVTAVEITFELDPEPELHPHDPDYRSPMRMTSDEDSTPWAV